MADHFHAPGRPFLRTPRAIVAVWTLFAAASAGAAPLPAPAPLPRAHIVEVKPAFLNAGAASIPGAGVRFFQDPAPQDRGAERFEIRWYANPPGLPPGIVLLLETLPERGATVKNHVLRTSTRAEGYVRSSIDIPAAEVQRAGRTAKWRVRIVWRGHLLASQSSPGWTDTRATP